MDTFTSLIDWSRAQFALTACYHWLFVPLTLGLGIIVAIMESIYYVKRDDFWKYTTWFWMKLFGINFAIGVATGLVLEFEFGTNWSNYSWFVGDIFGAPLAIEALLAFFMEAAFIGVMFFGRDKVSRGFHLSATWLTAIGATLSAWWILVANAWMQHPVGMHFNPDTVRNEMIDFWQVAFSGAAFTKFTHTVTSGWMTGAFFVIGVSSWFLLKRRNVEMARRSMRIGTIFGLVATLLVLGTGDRSGVEMAQNQPMKLAAAEGLQHGSTRAPFSIIPGVEIPGVLSILATHDLNGFVPGTHDLIEGFTTPSGKRVEGGREKIKRGRMALQDFTLYRKNRNTDSTRAKVALKRLEQNIDCFGYGHIEKPSDLIPPVHIVFWTFRIMVGIGSLLLLVVALLLWYQHKGILTERRWILRFGVACIPLVYLAGECGWAVAEVGRQPWAIQDLLPVNAAISQIDPTHVMTTFFIFAIVFTLLLTAEISIMMHSIKNYNGEEKSTNY